MLLLSALACALTLPLTLTLPLLRALTLPPQVRSTVLVADLRALAQAAQKSREEKRAAYYSAVEVRHTPDLTILQPFLVLSSTIAPLADKE